MSESAQEVDRSLKSRLTSIASVSDRLAEAMRYAIESPGKRLRPTLVLWCCELCGGSRDAAMPAAMAVECVHTFSLIHDDLPAIDDDDLRRGRATLHKQFDEATAILAGDALLALAFEIISQSPLDAALVVRMVTELARATGAAGMIGGEMADLEGETQLPKADLVTLIHAAKTARLFESCARLGAIAAGAGEADVDSLGRYGHALGMAFQAADDLLDITGSPATLGKPTQKDGASGKQTFPRAVGMEAGRAIAARAVEQAVEALTPFGAKALRLKDLARFVVERDS